MTMVVWCYKCASSAGSRGSRLTLLHSTRARGSGDKDWRGILKWAFICDHAATGELGSSSFDRGGHGSSGNLQGMDSSGESSGSEVA